jgi:uncharacterized protein YciI
MKYISFATYTSDKAKVIAHRPAHRAYLSDLFQQGQLIAAGPFTDDSGGLFIHEAESVESAKVLVTADPFTTNAVYEHCDLKPWTLVFANAEKPRTDR